MRNNTTLYDDDDLTPKRNIRRFESIVNIYIFKSNKTMLSIQVNLNKCFVLDISGELWPWNIVWQTIKEIKCQIFVSRLREFF